MELIELKADIRETTGNGPARVLRRDGKIPAILYGPDTESIMLAVGVRDLEQLLKKGKMGQLVLNVTIGGDGAQTRIAMIKELQVHPVSRQFRHVDLYEVSMDRKIRVNIPVTTKGKCAGVEMGGMLQIIRRNLEVLCFPNQIPEMIEIDVTEMNIGDSVHVDEIVLEGGLEVQSDVNFTVITVLSPTKEEVEVEEEEELLEGEEAEAPVEE